MKFLITASIAFMISLVITAQTNSARKLNIFITGGFAIPIDEMEKYADAGINLNLNAAYYLTRNFGVQGRFFSITNKSKTFTYDEANPQLYYPSSGGTMNTGFEFSAESWRSAGVVAGPVVRLNNKNISITFRALSGIQQVTSPRSVTEEYGYDWSHPDNSNYNYHSTQHLPELTDLTVPLDLGYSLNYYFKNHLFILFDFDYLSSIARMQGNMDYIRDEFNPASHAERLISISYSKSVSTLSLTTGIGWNF